MTSNSEIRRQKRQAQVQRLGRIVEGRKKPSQFRLRMTVMPGSVSDEESERKNYLRGASRPGKRKPGLPVIVLKEPKW